MDQPRCLQKLDIRVFDKNVIFSKCCITERINFKSVPISEVMALNDSELEEKIFTEYSSLTDIQELGQQFNCIGTCTSTWKSPPSIVYISHNICNFYCTMCRDSIVASDKKGLIKKCYFKILNVLSNSKRNIKIGTTTAGEPFIWKKEMLDFIKSCKKEVFITTNLSLFDNDIFTEIQNDTFKNVHILGSVDSFNPLVYSLIRRPATQELAKKVFNNVVQLINMSNENKIARFSINVVLSDINFLYDDIQNTLNFFNEHHFSNFKMSNDLYKDLSFYKTDWFTEELQNQCHFYFAS